ncbi:MAG: hypothetical protein H0Z24_06620 [Thermosipho sp. (in: Bacteria)]|nr:hypothetical protein [Thermosipho sp. (in: thermotogales)]
MIDKLKKYKVISVVGLEKNTGKTETLNYLLKKLCSKYVVAVTSIGVDGEEKDQITFTNKPNIILDPNTFFVTTENFFKRKTFLSEIYYVSKRKTATGRVIIAKSLKRGKIILAGPSTMEWLKKINEKLFNLGAEKILIDGALSRISSASPFISEAVVLATGASVSLDINKIISKTLDLVYKMNLTVTKFSYLFDNSENGFFGYNGKKSEKIANSILNFNDFEKLKSYGIVYTSGALTKSFLSKLINNKIKLELIVKDFSKIFVSKDDIRLFETLGGKITVLKKPNLCLITVNPLSPYGYKIDDEYLISKISEQVDIPVINIRKVDQNV